VNIVENTPTRLVMHYGGRMNAWVAWGMTILGGVATIGLVIALLVTAGRNSAVTATGASPAMFAVLAVSILLLLAGLLCLTTVQDVTCTFDKAQNRFIWRRKQAFLGIDEKQYPFTSIRSIEVSNRSVGGAQKSNGNASYTWFVMTKSGMRFDEPGPGSPTPYEADKKANRIRTFLGKSLVPTAQDTVGNERGIGDRTVFMVLGQLTDPRTRKNDESGT